MKREDGFSLVEVVVALGILSTAALGVSSLAQGSISGVKQIEERYLARTVASNQLADVFTTRDPLRIGLTSGQEVQMKRTFEWTREILPAEQDGLLIVEVRVTPTGSETVLARVTTLKGVL